VAHPPSQFPFVPPDESEIVMKNLGSSISRWIVRCLLLLFLGLIAFAVVVLFVIPRATHGTAMNVLTGSMTPTISTGSLIVDVPVDPGTLRVGDIATYQVAPGQREFITHRIVKIDTSTTPTTFIFKGDANRGADIKPVPASAIRGRVLLHVPYLGSLRDMMHTKSGVEGGAFAMLLVYALVQLGGGLKDRHAQRRLEVVTRTTDASLMGPSGPRLAMRATVAQRALDALAEPDAFVLLHARLVDDATTGSVIELDTAGDLLTRSTAQAPHRSGKPATNEHDLVTADV